MVIPWSIISGGVVSGDIIRPDLYVQIWALRIQVRQVKTQQRCHKFATASAEDIGSGLFQTSSFFAVFHDGPWMAWTGKYLKGTCYLKIQYPPPQKEKNIKHIFVNLFKTENIWKIAAASAIHLKISIPAFTPKAPLPPPSASLVADTRGSGDGASDWRTPQPLRTRDAWEGGFSDFPLILVGLHGISKDFKGSNGTHWIYIMGLTEVYLVKPIIITYELGMVHTTYLW